MPEENEVTVKYVDNFMVPKHELLDDKEAKKVLQELNISIKRLPKISIKDPALRGKGKPSQIVRIIREDVKGEKYFYYRVVVG